MRCRDFTSVAPFQANGWCNFFKAIPALRDERRHFAGIDDRRLSAGKAGETPALHSAHYKNVIWCKMYFASLFLRTGKAMNRWTFLILFFVFAVNAHAEEPLSLSKSIDLAMRNSPSILALQKERAAAQAGVQIEKQLNNPSLIAETTRSQPNYFVGAGYLFELGGKRAKRIQIASGELSLADLNYQLALQTLRHDVRIAFYTLFLAQKKQQEVGQSRDLAQKLRDVANQRFELGDVARLELLEAELELKRRENELKQAEAETLSARAQLNTLLHRNPTEPLEIIAALEDHPLELNLDLLVEGAVANHLNVATIRQQQKTQEVRLKLAHAEKIPDLDLEGGTEIHDADFQYGYRAAVRIDLPILNQKSGEVAQANANLERLKAEEQAAIQKVRGDISAAYLRYQGALQQTESYVRDILPASVEIEQLAVESYEAGKTGILAVIDAQRSVRQVRVEYYDVLMQLQTALADLEQASGVEMK
jgi:cobalt-zinc-cadmium efflux system outer membrane protein